MAEYASATARMRASRGISTPDQPSGIAGAVEALVVAGDERLDLAEVGHGADERLAHGGVALDDGPFLGGQPAGLAQDAVWDADLAHVVQQAARPHHPQAALGESQRGAEQRGRTPSPARCAAGCSWSLLSTAVTIDSRMPKLVFSSPSDASP